MEENKEGKEKTATIISECRFGPVEAMTLRTRDMPPHPPIFGTVGLSLSPSTGGPLAILRFIIASLLG